MPGYVIYIDLQHEPEIVRFLTDDGRVEIGRIAPGLFAINSDRFADDLLAGLREASPDAGNLTVVEARFAAYSGTGALAHAAQVLNGRSGIPIVPR